MPQLDGLRALAVGGVLVQHWSSWRTPWVDFGRAGVLLFFVLSGFLISGILLGARERSEANGLGLGGVLKAFYARRVLRIFPLYYGAVAVAAVVGFGETRTLLPWLLTYTQNVVFALDGDWYGGLAHFWTLAVEEQFYLFWPLFVLACPRRWIAPALVVLVALAPVSRVAHVALAPGQLPDVLTHENLDSLGIGSLLAVLGADSARGRTFARWGLGVGAVAYVGLTVAHLASSHAGYLETHPALGPSLVQLRHTATAGVFVWLVRRASIGFPVRGTTGVLGRTLTLRPLVYTGAISYGIYVVHLPAAYLWWELGSRLGVPAVFFTNELARFFPLLALTVGAAAVSWHLFEAPINSLKSRFPYTPRSPSDVSSTPMRARDRNGAVR